MNIVYPLGPTIVGFEWSNSEFSMVLDSRKWHFPDVNDELIPHFNLKIICPKLKKHLQFFSLPILHLIHYVQDKFEISLAF